ncbi:MAG: hypothetical protein ACE14P_04930 [Methanotrichaceae archaeon]
MVEEIELRNWAFWRQIIYQEAWRVSTLISSIIQPVENLIRGWLGFANAFLVEAFIMLGAIIGACLVAVLVKCALIRTVW